jgi:FdhD protein
MSPTTFDSLPVERPVQFWMDGRLLTTFYCTPMDLEDLALGFLMGRGLLDPACPPQIRVEEDPWRILAESPSPAIHAPAPGRAQESDWTTTLEEVVRQAEDTMEQTPLRKSSGGVHGASLRWSGGTVIREDIARHNAVDKVVGAGIIKGMDFTQTALFTTGRLSHEMLAKALAVGIPVVASMKYPSDLGVELAARNRMCVIGRALSPEPVVYTGGWRLGAQKEKQ